MNTTNLSFNYVGQDVVNSCCEQLKTFSQTCAEFQANIVNTYDLRFQIGFILLTIFIFIKIVLDNKLDTNEIYNKYFRDRMNLILMILSVCLLFILFFI